MPDPFRDGQPGHSPALERLAARNPLAAEILAIERLPDDDRDARVGIAIGDVAPIGCLAMLGYLGTIGLAIAWLVGAVPLAALGGGVAGVVVGHVYHRFARAAWQRRLKHRLRWVDFKPFAVNGIRGYLASPRPMIDVTFRRPPLLATLTAGVRGFDAEAEVIQIDDRTFRVQLHGGPDEAVLQRFVDEVLVPVDEDLGIEEVNLGGRLPDGARPALPART